MKTLLLIATLCVGGSLWAQRTVGTPVKVVRPTFKNANSSTSGPAVDQTVYSGVHGMVHVSSSCGTYIELSDTDQPTKLFVTNLPKEFEQDGTTIEFDYVQDAVTFPIECGHTKAVKVNNVKRQ